MITLMNSKKVFVGTGIVLLIIGLILTIAGFMGGSILGFVMILCGLLLLLTGIELVIHPNIEDFMQVVYAVINFFSPGPYIAPLKNDYKREKDNR